MFGCLVPVAFCLLPDKKKESYELVFQCIEKLLDDRNLKMSARYAMSDFEIGIRSAIENSFGGNIVQRVQFPPCTSSVSPSSGKRMPTIRGEQ
jgi:hypothetical protein